MRCAYISAQNSKNYLFKVGKPCLFFVHFRSFQTLVQQKKTVQTSAGFELES